MGILGFRGKLVTAIGEASVDDTRKRSGLWDAALG